MSQHDLEFADQLFPAMRQDMNNALIAHSTRQSGPGAPALVATARPNRQYIHDVSGLVFARDNGDTTDFIWDTWAKDKVRNVTAAADTILALDMNGVVTYSNADPIAVSLPEATGNFAAAWNTMLWNFGPGLVTITPVTSQINGVGSLQLYAGQSAEIFSKAGHYWAFKRVSDETKLVQTGAIVASFASSMTGYVLLNGLTIGNAASGATNRAHADTKDLFVQIWNNVIQGWAPVGGGRGASGLADFNANKVLTLPNASGCAILARDNMSGAARGLVTAAGSNFDANTLGAVYGSQYAQSHAHTANDPGHQHPPPAGMANLWGDVGTWSGLYLSAGQYNRQVAIQTHVSPAVTGITIAAALGGNNQNMSPHIVANLFCKL